MLPSLRSTYVTTLFVNIVIVVLGFIMSVLLNRWLGPAGRGELAAALAVSTLLPYIASTGFGSSVLYHAAPDHDGSRRTLAAALPIGLLQALVFGSAAWCLLPLLMREQEGFVVTSARVSLLALPANILVLYLLGSLQAQLRVTAFNRLRLVFPAGSLAGLLVLQVVGALSARGMVVVYIVSTVLLLALSVVYLHRVGLLTMSAPEGDVVRRLFRYGLKAQIGDLANSLNIRLDQVLIAAWLPVEQLGFYVAAIGATSVVSMLGYSILVVLQPRLLNEADERMRSSLLQQALCRYLMAAVAISAPLVLALPLAIPRLFGSEFEPAVLPSQILVVAALILGLKSILAGAAHANGLPWVASRAELIGVVVTIATLVILLPTMGIVGAALSSTGAYAVQAASIGVALRSRRGKQPPHVADLAEA